MSKNTNLNQAKRAKNDEFYTQYKDVEKEMVNYIEHFENQWIYLPCDTEDSSFWKYFVDNFKEFKLKQLTATHINFDGASYRLDYDGDTVTKSNLVGNGDFRSDECTKIKDKCDMVITNPPFSLIREFAVWLMSKKFIIMANSNAITYKEIFPYIKEGKVWLGCTLFTGQMPYFKVNDNYALQNERYERREDGLYKQVNSICWFTNIEHKKRNTPLFLFKKYNSNEYPRYDNYLGFECSKVANIPIDDYIEIEIDEKDFQKWKEAYGDNVEIIED